MSEFKIISINISKEKGTIKTAIEEALLKEDHGIIGDAHAGDWHRQISLLAEEDIDTMREAIKNKSDVELNPGIFAENITTEGVLLSDLSVGTKIIIDNTELEVTQIGKECHHGCEIFQKVGFCVMPKKGIFAKVIKGGKIKIGSLGKVIFP
ncbi:MAG: MOSC domain-containing protein [Pseudomonadota bacterium]